VGAAGGDAEARQCASTPGFVLHFGCGSGFESRRRAILPDARVEVRRSRSRTAVPKNGCPRLPTRSVRRAKAPPRHQLCDPMRAHDDAFARRRRRPGSGFAAAPWTLPHRGVGPRVGGL